MCRDHLRDPPAVDEALTSPPTSQYKRSVMDEIAGASDAAARAVRPRSERLGGNSGLQPPHVRGCPELSDVYQNPISAEAPALLGDVLPTFCDLWSRRIVV